MRRIVALLALCLLVPTLLYAQPPPQGYIGLYKDAFHEDWCIYGTGLFSVWCFVLAPETGMECVEFKTVPSSTETFLFLAPEYNPNHLEPIFGGVPGDLAVCFKFCQLDWVWVFRTTIFVMYEIPESIGLAPFTGSPYLKILDCEGAEIEALPHYEMGINDPLCVYPHFYPPRLLYVTVQDESHIVATFNTGVCYAEDPDKYHLFPIENPTDAIPVSSAELIESNQVLLTLDESLIQGITYTLVAENICNEMSMCSTTEVDFIFEPVAVMLQGFAAKGGPEGVELSWELAGVDGDVSFSVSRRDATGGYFDELGSIEIERDGDTYTCIDTYAEPGESYVYRVDYELDGETAVLFETDVVQTPAAPLTLHQNVPNPFNPSTEISYYLPASADVLLEVYDVTGKRVATLERGRREKGLHVVTWRGMDDAGRSAQSGIYFYRLGAGKEVMSKKMVLLR